ncbi:MAG: CvpA family protein [Candidatus Daviesbacteria bacterium]|nr:CvpA family protein [Candidatus Daviesbacteria bacterium]
MVYGFNWVDLVIIIALIFFTLEAIGRPLILEALDLTSFLLALFLSFRYYNFTAKFLEINFQIPHGLALVLGFMTIWFISETIFFLLVRLILPKIPRIKWSLIEDLGIIPAFLRGLVFISLTLVLLATFPIQPTIKKAVLDSKIGSRILDKAYGLEQPVKNVFGGITSDTLTFLTIKPKTDERVNLGFQTSEIQIDESSEREMINLLNRERTKLGKNTLTFDAKLTEVARTHSKDMFRGGYFSHYSPEGKTVADRATEAGIDFLIIGENLAYAPTVDLAHKGLMNSEGHRENILSEDYGKVGIGAIDGGVYGRMFTQVFSN